MILMTEKGIRGGICQASHRHVKANNPYMKMGKTRRFKFILNG